LQKRWTREEVLEEEFARLLGRLRVPNAFLKYTFRRLRTVHAAEAKAADASRRGLQGQINAAQKRLDALLQLKLSPRNEAGELLSDEEYLQRKREIAKEHEILQEQHQTVLRQGRTWIDDCEAFFRFTQGLVRAFAEGAVEEKKTLLMMICSNVTLTDRKVCAVLQEPYSALAELPIAGQGADFPFEPEKVAAASKEVLNSVSWLHLVTGIRTYTLPEEVAEIVFGKVKSRGFAA